MTFLDCPNWLLKWIALTLRYINKEKEVIYEEKLQRKLNTHIELPKAELVKFININHLWIFLSGKIC